MDDNFELVLLPAREAALALRMEDVAGGTPEEREGITVCFFTKGGFLSMDGDVVGVVSAEDAACM